MEELILALGHEFRATDLLQLALTHKSRANEQGAQLAQVQAIALAQTAGAAQPEAPSGLHGLHNNERLEFLGDAVLDLALSSILMIRFPNDSEGSLSKKRASLVNEERLAEIAKELRLETLILLGKGEIKTGGLQKPRILASALEAILGAVYQDGGFDSALQVVERLFGPRLEELRYTAVDFVSDFKTRLQERSQELHRATPTYQVESALGPDHDKTFVVSAVLDGQTLGTGSGRNKKAAEQEAAKQALERIENPQ